MKRRLFLKGIDASSAASVNKYKVAYKQLYESERRIVFCNEKSRDLTPLTGVSARIEKLSPEHPEEILIGLNQRDPQRFDLHRLDLRSGELKLRDTTTSANFED